MKANELKLGNTVKDSFGQIGNVINLSAKSVSVKHPYSVLKTSYSGIKPVEISEEWLANFGFKYNKGWFKAFGIDEEMQVDENYVYVRQTNTDLTVECFMIPYEIQYVHQLQNLYYALNCRELELVNSEKKY